MRFEPGSRRTHQMILKLKKELIGMNECLNELEVICVFREKESKIYFHYKHSMIPTPSGHVVVSQDECIFYSTESHLPRDQIPRFFPEISSIELSWGLLRRTLVTEEIQIYNAANADESNLIEYLIEFLRRVFW
jgi:hypothetical protein